MPKEFDSSKLGFSLGDVGSTDSDDIEYEVNNNIITGRCNRVMHPGEALTVRLELPEGYFVGASNKKVGAYTYLIFIIPIFFVVISFLLWKIFGKDDQVIETVEFYPPEGFNSLEIGFLYKGVADNQDVVSLLIYLANKGYIKISEFEEKTLFSKKKSFKITKLREYNGNSTDERLFLSGLFQKKASIKTILGSEAMQHGYDSDAVGVTSHDLYDNFYLTMNKILKNINSKENKNKIFEKAASGKSWIFYLMIIITYCLITSVPILAYNDTDIFLLPVALIFTGIGFTLMISMLIKGSISTKIFGLIWGGMFGGIPWYLYVLPCLLEDNIYLAGYITGMICILGMVICLTYLPKRTPYGNQMLGKLRGFKKFLETAEKQKLEA